MTGKRAAEARMVREDHWRTSRFGRDTNENGKSFPSTGNNQRKGSEVAKYLMWSRNTGRHSSSFLKTSGYATLRMSYLEKHRFTLESFLNILFPKKPGCPYSLEGLEQFPPYTDLQAGHLGGKRELPSRIELLTP